jgi:predicted TIM-barrel fold metal-dependent hydrolase
MIECIKAVGTKRIMFGSDLPIVKMRMFRTTENGGFYINNVPRGLYGDVSSDPHMRETDREDITNFLYEELLAFKRCAAELSLSRQDVEDILCNNAAKLFGMNI